MEFGALTGGAATTVTASLTPGRIDAAELRATRLTPDVALVTDLSLHASRQACRQSSLWVRHDERGRLMRFHKSTQRRKLRAPANSANAAAVRSTARCDAQTTAPSATAGDKPRSPPGGTTPAHTPQPRYA